MGLIRWIRGNEKFKKADIVLIIVLSLILAAFSFYLFVISENSVFYDVEQTSRWLQFTGLILSIPATVMMYMFHFAGVDVGGGDDLGSYLWGIFFSPILSFILWFCLFYVLAKISAAIFRGKEMIFRHGASILIVILLLFPYANYSFGTNKVDSCLSGALDTQFMSGNLPIPGGGSTQSQMVTTDPSYCFGDILDSMTETANPSSTNVINYCLGLSADKIVQGTQMSYRDYCIDTFGTGLYPINNPVATDFQKTYLPNIITPPSTGVLEAMYDAKLCDVYGSLTDSTANKNQCLTYFVNHWSANSGNSDMIPTLCADMTESPLPQACTEKNNPTTSTGTINSGINPYISFQTSPTPSDLTFMPLLFDENLTANTEKGGSVAMGTSTVILSASKEGTTNGAAWISIVVTKYVPLQAASFDVNFTNGKGAETLVTVFWDSQKIGQIDGRYTTGGHAGPWSFPETISGTSHVLGFRIDSFAPGQTSVAISNIQMGTSLNNKR